MPDSLVEEFESFFGSLPDNVRDDLSFMLIVLADEETNAHEPSEVYAAASYPLFKTATQFGQMGSLIYAASVLDIYFAMNVRHRFGSNGSTRENRSGHLQAKTSGLYDCKIDAIRIAKQRWSKLRATKFTAKRLAAALAPPAASRKRSRDAVRSPVPTSEIYRAAVS